MHSCDLTRFSPHWIVLNVCDQIFFSKFLHNGKMLWHGVKNSIWQKNCWSWIKSGEELWEWIFREIVQCGGEIIGKTMRSSPQVKIEKTLAFQQVGLIVFIFDLYVEYVFVSIFKTFASWGENKFWLKSLVTLSL